MASPIDHSESPRFRKADKIVTLLRAHRINADKALLMTDEEWKTTAACAGVNPPSEATRTVVISWLRFEEGEREFTKAFAPNRHGEYA